MLRLRERRAGRRGEGVRAQGESRDRRRSRLSAPLDLLLELRRIQVLDLWEGKTNRLQCLVH